MELVGAIAVCSVPADAITAQMLCRRHLTDAMDDAEDGGEGASARGTRVSSGGLSLKLQNVKSGKTLGEPS